MRVVRRSRHDVRLGIGIHSPRASRTPYFYPLHVFAPGLAEAADLAGRHLPRASRHGRRRHAATSGAGASSRRHAARRASRSTARWTTSSVRSTADGTWFVLVAARRGGGPRHDHAVARTWRAAIPFGSSTSTTRRAAAPPERVPGSVPLVGFRGRNLERCRPTATASSCASSCCRLLSRRRRALRSADAPLTAAVTAAGRDVTPRAPAAAASIASVSVPDRLAIAARQVRDRARLRS